MKVEKQRVQFDFTLEQLARLDTLKEMTDATTRAEVMRDALKLYEWFIFQKLDPACIIEIKDTQDKEIFRIPLQLLLM